jgi:hypothetical protein
VRAFFFAGALATLIAIGTAPQPASASPPAQVGIYVGPAYYPTYSYFYPAYSYYYPAYSYWGPRYYRPYRYRGYYGRPYRYYGGYRDRYYGGYRGYWGSRYNRGYRRWR